MSDKIIDTFAGPFDEARYKKFKKAYDQAVKDGKVEYIYDHQPLLTSFAKHLVDFLEMSFKPENK